MFGILAASCAWLLIAPGAVAPADDLRTIAEKTDYKATARHAEVVALCEALARSSPLIRLTELGKSAEGRSLPLMIVSDPPVSTAEEARTSGKLIVFLFGNIHAGEVDGKEALPMLVRDLVAKPGNPLLKKLVLCVAPIYNADGNERVAKTNRPGQVGPEEGMGIRENAQGLDLNRDFMKLEAPETRALVRFLNDWNPDLTIDTHTTNGSHHRYTMTYEGPKNPAGSRSIIDYMREKMLPQVGTTLEIDTGYKSFFYGNFEGDHTRWTSYPATPRFGTTYIGLRNRLSILTEAYSYAPFKDRVLVTRDYCLGALRYAADHRAEITKLLDAANEEGYRGGQLGLRSKARPFPGKSTVLGFVEKVEGGRSVATDEPKDYPCVIEQDFVATAEAIVPFAYLVPARYPKAIDVLRAHGLRLEKLDEAADIRVDVTEVVRSIRASRVSEGHQTIDLAESVTKTDRRTIPAGTILVRTRQPLGRLAAYLLEPRSDDGLLTWNFFDDALEPGKDFPVVRIREASPLKTSGLD